VLLLTLFVLISFIVLGQPDDMQLLPATIGLLLLLLLLLQLLQLHVSFPSTVLLLMLLVRATSA
jgi:hypothetical protein